MTTTSTTSPWCPHTVERPVMIHRWDLLTFLHWRFPAATVQRLLPPGLTVETFDGDAWVGLVPFQMEVRPRRGGTAPWIARFCETNVRTYVVAPDGTRGVWFLSLDAGRLAAVVSGRHYRLPYRWSAMDLAQDGSDIIYRCVRRWPGPAATSYVHVAVGERYEADELGDLDHFLTARWRLYTHRHGAVSSAPAAHEPWPLHRATPIAVDDMLIIAAGLPTPVGAPLCHWSPGVEVRIGGRAPVGG